MTEPVVFQNFGSKADLFVAVLDRAAEQATTLLDPSADALAALTHLLEPGVFEKMHQRGGPGGLFSAPEANAMVPGSAMIPLKLHGRGPLHTWFCSTASNT